MSTARQMGWYIGPALNHYRCPTFYIPSTGDTRVTGTAKFINSNTPKNTVKFTATQTANELIKAIKDVLQQKPITIFAETQLKTMKDIENLFKNTTTKNNEVLKLINKIHT